MSFFNRASHVLAGAYVAWGVNDSEKKAGALTLASVFGAYQLTEAWKKGDDAYGEIKEFAIGYASVLLLIRAKEWLYPKEVEVGHRKPERRYKGIVQKN